MSFLKSKHYLKSTQDIIDKDLAITSIEICKTPLSKLTIMLLNIVSKGELHRKMADISYDKLYHLYMILTTQSGKYILEKNEVITLKKFTSKKKDTETMTVKANLSLNTLLEKTKNRMGDKYFNYQGLTNNCQVFIDSILSANGLNNATLSGFIKQKTENLLSEKPRKIVNTVTDIGAVTNHITQKVKEIATQPIQKSFVNELLDPIKRHVTLPDMVGFIKYPFNT